MPEMIGALLNGRYCLDAEIGRGGMGVVYLRQTSFLHSEWRDIRHGLTRDDGQRTMQQPWAVRYGCRKVGTEPDQTLQAPETGPGALENRDVIWDSWTSDAGVAQTRHARQAARTATPAFSRPSPGNTGSHLRLSGCHLFQ
jgi:hypothetical protein